MNVWLGEAGRCFIEDGGRPSEVSLQGAGFKPPQAAGVKSPGGERCGKGGSNSVR